MASFLFNTAKVKLLQSTFNLGNTTNLGVRLVNYTGGPTATSTNTASVVADLAALNIPDASGVTPVTGLYAEIDNPGNGEVIISFNNSSGAVTDNNPANGVTSTTWTSVTTTANGAVIYSVTGNHVIAFIDFGSPKSASNGNFTINWDTTGVIGWN